MSFDQPGVGVSFVAPLSGPTLAGCRILLSRITDELRTRRGVTYHADMVTTLLDADATHVSIVADCRSADAVAVAKEILEAMQSMAQKGPTAEELAFDGPAVEEYCADPRSVHDELDMAAAQTIVTGSPTTSENLLADQRAVSADDVARLMKAALDHVLVIVPAGVDPSPIGVPLLEPLHVAAVSGQEFQRRMVGSSVPRGSRVIVGDEGVTLHLGRDSVTVRFEDVVGVEDSMGEKASPASMVRIAASDGTVLELAPHDWRSGPIAIEQLMAKVPPALVYRQRTDR